MPTQYKGIKVNGKKIDEHRHIAQQIAGRTLSRFEVVHHKDGNPRNNHSDNLEIMSLSEHSYMHQTGQRKQGYSGPKIKIDWVKAQQRLEKRKTTPAHKPKSA